MALQAVDARRRDEWERLSWGLLWIVNSMPSFSETPRQSIGLDQLNPMLERVESRPSGLSGDAMEAALDRVAMRYEQGGTDGDRQRY